MRLLTRIGAATAGMAALLTLVTGTVLAGGWAEATILTGSEDPPVAGEEREVRFSLLQHGVTAVDDGNVFLTATHPESGKPIVVQATSLGGGRWSAMVAFPTDGTWEIAITHDSLATSGPIDLAVGSAPDAAWLPPAVAVGAFGAIALAAVVLLARGRPRVKAEPLGAA